MITSPTLSQNPRILSMACLSFHQTPTTHSLIFHPKGLSNRVQHGFSNRAPLRKPFLRRANNNGAMNNSRFPSAKASIDLPPFPLFQPPPKEEDSLSELQPADPDFYRIGFARMVRAYGVEFKEGPDGYGVFASRDVEPLRRARVIMEIPLELMLTISQKLPWMFEPDIIPIGHPIFDIINSTNPEDAKAINLLDKAKCIPNGYIDFI